MTQNFQLTEGIILRAIPFRDYDQILSIFTADAGLIKVLYKGSRSKCLGVQGLGTPLTRVEVIYRETRGEIFSCHEMTLLDSFSFLRKKWLNLEVACDLLQVLLASQFVGKAAVRLYALLCFYLEKIPHTLNPWILAMSFRLKLLKHDGLMSFPFLCCECHQPLQALAFTRDSENWCLNHQPIGSLIWEQAELQLLYRLATCQSYQEIRSSEISLGLQNKVIAFFDACVKK
jgi:DNA repair protein RecO (recombination protein O)